MKLELHKKILSGAKNYPDFYRNCVSQNEAKNAGCSRKNAGNRQKCGISRTIAGWLTPMYLMHVSHRLAFDSEGLHSLDLNVFAMHLSQYLIK